MQIKVIFKLCLKLSNAIISGISIVSHTIVSYRLCQSRIGCLIAISRNNPVMHLFQPSDIFIFVRITSFKTIAPVIVVDVTSKVTTFCGIIFEFPRFYIILISEAEYRLCTLVVVEICLAVESRGIIFSFLMEEQDGFAIDSSSNLWIVCLSRNPFFVQSLYKVCILSIVSTSSLCIVNFYTDYLCRQLIDVDVVFVREFDFPVFTNILIFSVYVIRLVYCVYDLM